MDLKGQDNFKGKIVHSSELDGVDLRGKRVIVVGGGASGIEALELAVEKQAKSAIILARSDKWIIPRSTIIDIVLALNPFGRQGILMGPVAQFLIRKLHYRDLEDKMAPYKVPLFAGTPIVNNSALTHIREGKADYQRGDLIEVQEHGVLFNKRGKTQKKGEEGEHVEYEADVIVVATGFNRPTLDFLPKDLFPEDYTPPSCYLQVFPVQDPSVLLTNATYKNAIGTVGNWHIGIYARIAMVLLMDQKCRPHPRNMRLWTDLIRFIKEKSPVRLSRPRIQRLPTSSTAAAASKKLLPLLHKSINRLKIRKVALFRIHKLIFVHSSRLRSWVLQVIAATAVLSRAKQVNELKHGGMGQGSRVEQDELGSPPHQSICEL
ncbi:unnamed protein product [Tilletia controversa]|nr:unnamed protein product [Tilletia controversa]